MKASEFSLVYGIKLVSVRRFVLSVEMLLAVIVTAIVTVASYPREGNALDFSFILSTYSAVCAAMLGLVIAAYAIFVSVGKPSYLKVLIDSGLYRDAVTMFAWTGLVLVLATVVGLASLSFANQSQDVMWMIFTVSSFLAFYGVFCVGVLAVSSLRIINELRVKFLEQTRFED